MRRFVIPVVGLAWLAFVVGPITLSFAPPGTGDPFLGELSGVYTASEKLLLERWGRWIFSGLHTLKLRVTKKVAYCCASAIVAALISPLVGDISRVHGGYAGLIVFAGLVFAVALYTYGRVD